MKKDHEPVFPENYKNQDGSIDQIPGLTKREYFAAMAMQGILASSADRGEHFVAEMAVKFADAVLTKLEL